MSIPLQYSEYNNPPSKNIKKNKTYKKRSTKKVQNFLQSMDDNKMENFEDGYPEHPQKPAPLTKKTDEAVTSFNDLPDIQNNNSDYQEYVPYYTNVENKYPLSENDNGMLMKKLNYMIHLLEEQQEDKTANVAEELILYLFLGIFVIFVVDSFARAGKYTR